MKKLILTIISVTFISSVYVQASSKVEMVTSKTSSIKMNQDKNALTIELCKKKMGIDNYNFIKEIFNDESVVMMKCTEALNK
jgi:hypothetical protein